MNDLPITPHLPKIQQLISHHQWVSLKSSPGSGKTTMVPPYLYTHGIQSILILVPRKIMAKYMSERVANFFQEPVGNTVGYLFRGEKNVSSKTKILFITEGVLLKFLEEDPLLKKYDLCILDEFHERHLETDLAFYALWNISQKRSDLKILFMSATLDQKSLLEKIPQCQFIEVHAPPHPLKIHYLPPTPSILKKPLTTLIRETLLENELHNEKSILVFLPGKKEIMEVFQDLSPYTQDNGPLKNYHLSILHGELSPSEIEKALTPPKTATEKKIILSTNIAESSLTIPFVNVAIDSGLERVWEDNIHTGFGKLLDKKAAQSSLIQRAGRTNRTQHGLVFRLFSELDYSQRKEHKPPQILSSHLALPYLNLLKAGLPIHRENFFDPPPKFHHEKSLDQLQFLGLIKDHTITKLGKSIDGMIGVRLSLLLVSSPSYEQFYLNELLKYLENIFPGGEVKHEFLKSWKRWAQSVALQHHQDELKNLKLKQLHDQIELHLLRAYVDLLGIFSNGKMILHNGQMFPMKKNSMDHTLHLQEGDYAIVVSISPFNDVDQIIPIEKMNLLVFLEQNPDLLHEYIEEHTATNQVNSLKQIIRKKFGVITISEEITYKTMGTEEKRRHTETILKNFYEQFINSEIYRRLKFFAKYFSEFDITLYQPDLLIEYLSHEWPDLGDQNSLDSKMTTFQEEIIGNILDFLKEKPLQSEEEIWDRSFFEMQFPTHLLLKNSKKFLCHYEIHHHNFEVIIEGFIQDFYGLDVIPGLVKGNCPVTLRIRGPHKQIIQTTKDLKSFWKQSYLIFYKEFSREYPRHHWSAEPWKAPAILLKRQLP